MRKNGLKHLTRNERTALDQFLARLQAKYPDQILRVVLFGSKVRGDFDVESDLDVFVLVKSDDWHLHDELATVSSPISLKYNTLISPKVIGPSLYGWCKVP
jgi:predicted nucleotidyltransferase